MGSGGAGIWVAGSIADGRGKILRHDETCKMAQ